MYVPTTTGSSVKASPSASVGKSCESYPATVTLPAGSWISSWASWVTGGTEKV